MNIKHTEAKRDKQNKNLIIENLELQKKELKAELEIFKKSLRTCIIEREKHFFVRAECNRCNKTCAKNNLMFDWEHQELNCLDCIKILFEQSDIKSLDIFMLDYENAQEHYFESIGF